MLTIGSRGSKLALWQANWVKGELEKLGHTCRIEIIHTTGDRITDVPLAKVGTKGLFTKEIEEALLDRRVDVAVHSLKDMPTDLPLGLKLAAIPRREDAEDALVACRLTDLPRGARVGTSSLRRSAQLRAFRPDLDVQSIRGNIDTRLRKLDEGQFQAILLAVAGLRRLGWEARIAERLSPELMCPAVGQGALAIETREDSNLVDRLEDTPSRWCVSAERALLAEMGGGCQVPLGAHAVLENNRLHLRSVVVSPDGTTLLRRNGEAPCASVDDAQSLGRRVAHELLDGGARQILEAVYGA